jgi:hypothetical protein
MIWTMRRRKSLRPSVVKNDAHLQAKAAFLAAFVCLGACSDAPSDGLDSGGLTPPPGFLNRVDANCRMAAEGLTISEKAPKVRQLNGQSLLTYASSDSDSVVCAVRHSDESVIDIRVIHTD